MKKTKLLLLALCAIALTGCGDCLTKIEQYDMDKDPSAHISEFTHKGHDYLLYQRWIGRDYGVAGITHDPDCPCREKGGKDD